MSSSPEATVLRGGHADDARALSTPELRTGAWTRFGNDSVLGDTTTEDTLSSLATSARDAARAQGYAVGWAEGRRQAAERADAEHAQHRAERAAADQRRATEHAAALEALTTAARELSASLEGTRSQVCAQALTLARELTTALVGHELRRSPDLAADVVARVLAVLPDDAPVAVRLHPATAVAAATGPLRELGVRVREDDALAPYDAVVEVDERIIDLRLDDALARVREALS